MGEIISPIISQFCLLYSKITFSIAFITSIFEGIEQTILDLFNGYDIHIQFTMEDESNNNVAFLDTKLIQMDHNKINLCWYCKATNSSKYMNYFSYHLEIMTINLVLALKNKSLSNELYRLFEILGKETLWMDNTGLSGDSRDINRRS